MSFDNIGFIANKYGWTERPSKASHGGHRKFEKHGGEQKIELWNGGSTMKTVGNHPKGRNQMHRKNLSGYEVERVFKDWRYHSGKRYHDKNCKEVQKQKFEKRWRWE